MCGKFEAYLTITSRWHLTNSERRALLGAPTDERWFQLTHDGALSLTAEELLRVQSVIQIDAALSTCHESVTESARWFRTLFIAPPFYGRTPLAVLFRGQEGFKLVAEYLEACRPQAEVSARS